MGDAKTSIENAFKEIVAEKPYQKITVSEICDRAFLSRRAFYSHFKDKEEIVADLFDLHVIKPLRDIHALLHKDDIELMQESIVVRMYENVYTEGEYYRNLIGPMRGHDDTFLRVVTWAIYDYNRGHIPLLSDRPDVQDWIVDYIAYFFASSQAMLMQKWISEGMVISPKELAGLYIRITMQFWRNIGSWDGPLSNASH